MRTPTNIILIGALAIALFAQAPAAHGQERPDVNYLTQTTARIVIPTGMKEKDMWDAQQEYFDKVLSKSTLLKHYSIYRHAYGSEGATVVTNLEFAKWEDIMKFNDEERVALEKAAWPDEKIRNAFLDKLNAFQDRHHKDEIYSISNTMRK